MTAGQPRWRHTFDTAERAVGRPLENLVGSPRYLDVALLARRVRGAAGAVVSAPTSAVLHLFNLPTRDDVRKLSRQIAALTNDVRQLAGEVDELRRPMPRRTPRRDA